MLAIRSCPKSVRTASGAAVRRALALAALLAGSFCAPALRPPQALPPTPTGASPAGPEDTDALLARAAERFSARCNANARTAAADAQALFLAAANADPLRIEGLVGVVRVASWRIEHIHDAGERERLVASELDAAQWCGRRAAALAAPEAKAEAVTACDYWLAIALGQQAREHPSTASDALERMVTLLRRTAAERPALDEAGPDRVLALLLLRAPGWPAGPGDPEEGLAAARRAATSAPSFPPNQLTLAEALARNGAAEEARAAATRGRELALASSDPDAAEWVGQADALLRSGSEP